MSELLSHVIHGGLLEHPGVQLPGYTACVLPNASAYPLDFRQRLMDAMNGIIATNWDAREPHWTPSSSPFQEGFGLTLVGFEGELVAFSVYRKLRIGNRPAIYRSGTEVLPFHQGRGLYAFFTGKAIRSVLGEGEAEEAVIFYGWRTRNPIVWAANAKVCDKVLPSLLCDKQDPELQIACVAMHEMLYPGSNLEVPKMIVRGAYGHITHRSQHYHGTALLVHAAMERLIPNPADALFSVGFARL